jgi:predicted GNAT family acetyltransferase
LTATGKVKAGLNGHHRSGLRQQKTKQMNAKTLRKRVSDNAAGRGKIIHHSALAVEPLTSDDLTEVLAFLSERPAHTFGLTGLIRENGLVSPKNRGGFYACRDAQGNMEGVALIGYNTLLETRSDNSIRAFAHLARTCPTIFLILGEEEVVQKFWYHYAESEQAAAEGENYVLLGQSWPIEVCEPVPELRLATMEDLELVVTAHALSGIEETGVDGRELDPTGFPQRCANRIENRHTWVWINDGKLVFKIEILTDTPEIIYLESMWIDPAERSRGYGLRCMAQLGRELLSRASAICLLVQEKNVVAQAMYKKAGYRTIGYYQAIFLGN